MIRSELIEKLVETHSHLSRPVVEAALHTILDEIIARLAQGERVEMRGFGNFSSRVRDARKGYNPRTGERIHVPPNRILHFRASRLLLERLNRS